MLFAFLDCIPRIILLAVFCKALLQLLSLNYNLVADNLVVAIVSNENSTSLAFIGINKLFDLSKKAI